MLYCAGTTNWLISAAREGAPLGVTAGQTNTSEQQPAELSAQYIRFAEEEAHGRSSLYEALALGVARDQDAIAFLMTAPTEKRQPNLLFASVRHLLGLSNDWPHFRQTLLANADAVRSIMLTRSTQTNEPARCATLLPVLARLPQPLALIELGASAGLCLLPDLYGYDYGGHLVCSPEAEERGPVFTCSVNQATPLPRAMPRVVWRAGLDLNPLDPTDPSHADWLETLVWPEQTQRLANLRAALRIAAAYRLRNLKGDMLGDDLAQLCREAPKDATLVVFHTAVLGYVAGRAERQAFAERVMSFCPYWICNEPPRVLPEMANRAGISPTPGQFLMAVNGAPVAWTDPHGAALEWIAAENWMAV
jgi:hypothetical protein